jgi:hypothetical protein
MLLFYKKIKKTKEEKSMAKPTQTVVALIDQLTQNGKGCILCDAASFRLIRTTGVIAVATDGDKVAVETENRKFLIDGGTAEQRKRNFGRAICFDGTVKVHGTVFELEVGRGAKVLTKGGMFHTSPVLEKHIVHNKEVTFTTRNGGRYIIAPSNKPL